MNCIPCLYKEPADASDTPVQTMSVPSIFIITVDVPNEDVPGKEGDEVAKFEKPKNEKCDACQ